MHFPNTAESLRTVIFISKNADERFLHRFSRFFNSNLLRSQIISFIRLRLGYNRLRTNSFYLGLKSFPHYPRYLLSDIGDFLHLLFNLFRFLLRTIKL